MYVFRTYVDCFLFISLLLFLKVCLIYLFIIRIITDKRRPPINARVRSVAQVPLASGRRSVHCCYPQIITHYPRFYTSSHVWLFHHQCFSTADLLKILPVWLHQSRTWLVLAIDDQQQQPRFSSMAFGLSAELYTWQLQISVSKCYGQIFSFRSSIILAKTYSNRFTTMRIEWEICF